MLRRQVSVLLAFLLLAGGLGFGIVQLFDLRMAGGDVFPPYSSLRADPLGTKVLLDSLNDVPRLNAWRNYRPLVRLKPDAPITLVYAGIALESRWEEKELSHFEELVSSGSRAVFAFSPEKARTPEAERRREEAKQEKEKAKQELRKKLEDQANKKVQPEKKEPEKKVEPEKKQPAAKAPEKKAEPEKKEERPRTRLELMLEDKGVAFETVAAKWGFRFKVPIREKDAKAPNFTVEAEPGASELEQLLPWHSELWFDEVKPPWKPLYSMGDKPVVIERPWGKGSIILASDSYFLSNEGLYGKDRAPKFLAHLLGAPRTIVFDEEHLGVSEDAGISTLAKKYRLHGLVAGLLLIAALFIWQNIVRFVPPRAEVIETDALVTGRGSSEGFLVLLRRSVPAGQLLATCTAEWRRAFTHDTRALERFNAAEPPLPPRKGPEIVAAYAAMAKAVISNQKPVVSQPTGPTAASQPPATSGH
ncbi:MAG TPA: hypothetical protein VGO11_00595 [Chthoniobacteraceae bacterium]|jgi:hypothetical protein|nr:hypothetical protein [Chthoniobacteraceae bacterium]